MFNEMYKSFKLFIAGDKSQNLCSINDAKLTLDKCWDFLNKDDRENLKF